MSPQRSDASVSIARAPADVFPWLVDTERRLRWVSGLESSELLSGAPGAEGSRYRETLSQGGARVTVETTIERLDAPRELALRAEGRGVRAGTLTRLEEEGGGTRVVSTIDTEVQGLAGRIVGGVVARQAQASLERSLQTLKRLVEAAG